MKRNVLCLMVCLFCLSHFPVMEGRTLGGDGFTKIDFKFEGRDAFLVVPDKALPGNPWVWRAYFPRWHTEIDSILIQKGYHIAYVNTSDMFGSPESMAVWDRFYGYLLKHYNLSARVALEGVSRGGLYVHTWAKHNPMKVSCIYAEVPVCDFRTWPMKVSSRDWELLKKSYRFSDDEEAVNYKDMPVYNLQGLAALKVPVLHSICNIDKIVPPVENSMVFGLNYLKAGGSYGAIQQYKVFNLKNMKGHHFHLQQADKIAEFIHQYSYPVKKELVSSDYHHFNETKVLRSKVKAEREKQLNVVFLGGSITYNPGWRENLEYYFKSRFPDADITFYKAGIPSLGSVPHAFRYRTDVLDHIVPDILFYEAAVNDRSNGYSKSEQQKSIEGIIRNTKKVNPNADIIMMHFADPQKLDDYSKNREPMEIVNHNEVAAYYKIPVIDISREIYDRIANGEFTWDEDIKDLHPSVFGQEYYSQSMKTMLDTLLNNTPENLEYEKKSILPRPMYKSCYSNAAYVSVDKASGSFKYESKYVPSNGQAVREGFTNVPMLTGEKVGNRLKFPFEGNAVGICVISGNDAGMIRYRVDKKPYKTVDLYTRWSHALHLPWYLVLDDDLKSGKHTLEMEIIADKNEKSRGNACRIVHFLVNGK